MTGPCACSPAVNNPWIESLKQAHTVNVGAGDSTVFLNTDGMTIAERTMNYEPTSDHRRPQWIVTDVKTLGPLPPETEICKRMFSDTLPESLTYPAIQPYLFEKVKTVLKTASQ